MDFVALPVLAVITELSDSDVRDVHMISATRTVRDSGLSGNGRVTEPATEPELAVFDLSTVRDLCPSGEGTRLPDL